jgi:hypothetical protein
VVDTGYTNLLYIEGNNAHTSSLSCTQGNGGQQLGPKRRKLEE